MRIKVEGNIIEKTKPFKTNYSHETWSMILNNLSSGLSEMLHQKKKFFRLLTFTNICINKNKAHFYVSGEDKIITDLVKHLQFNEMIRIDDTVIVIKNISLLPQLRKKENNKYSFKSKIIINVFNNETNKNELADLEITRKRLIKNSLDKCKQLGIEGNIKNIEIINPSLYATKYKNGVIKSYRCRLNIEGDYNVMNTIFNVGIGENTASGHGFLWEVNSLNETN